MIEKEISSERLHYRKITESDGAVLHAILSDPLYCFADAFTDNPASNALIRKCGYTYVEDYTMYFEKLGRTMTCHSYVI